MGNDAECNDHLARGMAANATQSVQSLDRIVTAEIRDNKDRWADAKRATEQMESRISAQVRELATSLGRKIDDVQSAVKEQVRDIQVKFEVASTASASRFEEVEKTADDHRQEVNAKFWQMAVGVIATLLALVGALAWHTFFGKS